MKININTKELSPIMGPCYDCHDFQPIILDQGFLLANNVGSIVELQNYQNSLRANYQAKWLIGGYLERRSLYQSSLFKQEGVEARDIHIGVDIWGAVQSPVYAPIPGSVHSFAYNNQNLDYGYTVILEHDYNGNKFHTLYGHLSSEFYSSWEIGSEVRAGEIIGTFGSEIENGGWLPHLHFQLIIDMEGKKGDYPGVCKASRIDYYRENCPNANLLIKKAP